MTKMTPADKQRGWLKRLVTEFFLGTILAMLASAAYWNSSFELHFIYQGF